MSSTHSSFVVFWKKKKLFYEHRLFFTNYICIPKFWIRSRVQNLQLAFLFHRDTPSWDISAKINGDGSSDCIARSRFKRMEDRITSASGHFRLPRQSVAVSSSRCAFVVSVLRVRSEWKWIEWLVWIVLSSVSQSLPLGICKYFSEEINARCHTHTHTRVKRTYWSVCRLLWKIGKSPVTWNERFIF